MVAADLATRVHALLPQLAPTQREVVWLRDVEGMSSDAVRNLLGVSDGNQRVLLHRGRTKLRQLLSAEMGTR
jgi:RNA polymerase sigma-70 factor (ECF subfamily)